jgi:hypothetical protein
MRHSVATCVALLRNHTVVPLVKKREPDAVRFDVHVLRCLARLAA